MTASPSGASTSTSAARPRISSGPGGGVHWMKDPGKARELVEATRAAIPARAPLGEDARGLRRLLRGHARLRPGARGRGGDYVTLHPRLKAEKFRRAGRWDYVARLARDLPVPWWATATSGPTRDCERAFSELRPGRPHARARGRAAALDLRPPPRAGARPGLRARGRRGGLRAPAPRPRAGTPARQSCTCPGPGDSSITTATTSPSATTCAGPSRTPPTSTAIESAFRRYFAETPGDRVKIQSN